jgi:hypothetical protein
VAPSDPFGAGLCFASGSVFRVAFISREEGETIDVFCQNVGASGNNVLVNFRVTAIKVGTVTTQ